MYNSHCVAKQTKLPFKYTILTRHHQTEPFCPKLHVSHQTSCKPSISSPTLHTAPYHQNSDSKNKTSILISLHHLIFGILATSHFFASACIPLCTQFLVSSAFLSISSGLNFAKSNAVCGLGTCRPFSKPGRSRSVCSHLSRAGNSSSETPAQAIICIHPN